VIGPSLRTSTIVSIKEEGPLWRMPLEYSNKLSNNLHGENGFTHDHRAQHDKMLSHPQFATCKK